jgi:hypothetical protein
VAPSLASASTNSPISRENTATNSGSYFKMRSCN